MSIELPVLRLGLAGFSVEQHAQLSALVHQATSGGWEVGKFAEADAWWVNGSRVQVLLDSTIRVAPGEPSGRSVHLDLNDVDRPVAFALPLAPRHLEPLYTFQMGSESSVRAVLEKFEGWMQPFVAQFCLAASILEQQSVMRPGIHHVSANGALIAVVNMQGETGVLPTASPIDFENAMWQRIAGWTGAIPDHFVRSGLAHLMWQFAVRTSRDILPARYRTGPLYFRRPPRLPPRLMKDSHLLLLRELAGAPGDFEGLQQRTGLGSAALARALAALYFVGAITSNVKRAAPMTQRHADSRPHQQSVLPSGMDPESPSTLPGKVRPFADLTAPALIGPR